MSRRIGVVGVLIAALIGVVLVTGVFMGSRKERSPESEVPPSPTMTSSEEEPDDIIAGQGGQGPRLVFTGWDAPIGRGGTLGGVMETDLQNRAVATISQDYRARHGDAPDDLVGEITNANFDAGPQILTFTASIENEHYAVRVDTAHSKLEVTSPDGKKLPLA